MKLTCRCLNVSLDFNSDANPIPKLNADLSKKDNFFAQKPKQGTVNLKGEGIKLNLLVNTRLVGSWTIYHCKGCHLDTHALAFRSSNPSVSPALVSSELLSDSKAMAALRQSPLFSATFDIVLPQTIEQPPPSITAFKSTVSNFFRRMSSTPGISVADSKSFQLDHSLQAKVAEYLADEEARTNERILQFTEQQQSAFLSLQLKATEDKNLLLRLISGQEAQIISELIPSTSQKQVPSLSSQLKSPQTSMVSVSSPEKGRRPSSVDADSVFPLDGEDLLNDVGHLPETFDPLDDEQDTDNSNVDEGISIPRHSSSSSYQMARSVPMKVPTMMTLSKEQGTDDIDSKTPKDPEEMAASIQALARSIHGNASFWDVPRPRLNTLH